MVKEATVNRKRILYACCKKLADMLADLIEEHDLSNAETMKICSSTMVHSINGVLIAAGMGFKKYDAYNDLLQTGSPLKEGTNESEET